MIKKPTKKHIEILRKIISSRVMGTISGFIPDYAIEEVIEKWEEIKISRHDVNGNPIDLSQIEKYELDPKQIDMSDVFCKEYKLDLNKFSEAFDNNKVEITIHGLDTQINGYKERIKELEAEVNTLECSLKEVQSELDDMEYDRDNIQDELDDRESDISDLEYEIQELKQSSTFMSESINHQWCFEKYKELLNKIGPINLEQKLSQL